VLTLNCLSCRAIIERIDVGSSFSVTRIRVVGDIVIEIVYLIASNVVKGAVAGVHIGCALEKRHDEGDSEDSEVGMCGKVR